MLAKKLKSLLTLVMFILITVVVAYFIDPTIKNYINENVLGLEPVVVKIEYDLDMVTNIWFDQANHELHFTGVEGAGVYRIEARVIETGTTYSNTTHTPPMKMKFMVEPGHTVEFSVVAYASGEPKMSDKAIYRYEMLDLSVDPYYASAEYIYTFFSQVIPMKMRHNVEIENMIATEFRNNVLIMHAVVYDNGNRRFIIEIKHDAKNSKIQKPIGEEYSSFVNAISGILNENRIAEVGFSYEELKESNDLTEGLIKSNVFEEYISQGYDITQIVQNYSNISDPSAGRITFSVNGYFQATSSNLDKVVFKASYLVTMDEVTGFNQADYFNAFNQSGGSSISKIDEFVFGKYEVYHLDKLKEAREIILKEKQNK